MMRRDRVDGIGREGARGRDVGREAFVDFWSFRMRVFED